MDLLIIAFNKAISLLKYPIAFLFSFLILKFTIVLFAILLKMYQNPIIYKEFFMGMGIYILSILLFKNRRGNWFFTIEHELTHVLFALLTFHKIIDFKASDRNGGHILFSGVGGGNWLITISPYFFPTYSMIVIISIYFFEPRFYPFLVMLLGYSMLYHIHSTYYEISLNQPDIKEAGIIFSFLFLPGANLLALIMILSAIPNDNIKFFVIVDNFYKYLYSLFHSFLY